MLYGAENWTLTKYVKETRRSRTVAYSRILRITWEDMISNEIVLRRIQSEMILTKSIKERKLRYFGHLVRRGDLQRVLME